MDRVTLSDEIISRMDAAGLSNTQRRIGSCLIQGMTNAEISATLNYRISWVRECVTEMLSKTGATNRTQLALYLTGHMVMDDE